VIAAASALYTSESQTWNTPAEVVDRLRAFDPRGVVLDPCSNDSSIVGAAEEWRIERGEDGLARPWPDLGLVYVNPPYDELERWAAKMVREAARHVEILALIPARTDTAAFQRHILPTCTAIAFWRGRLKYGAGRAHSAQPSLFGDAPAELDAGQNVAPFPACLPYWGLRPHTFLRAMGEVGWGVVCR
jgi:hypothetical protein